MSWYNKSWTGTQAIFHKWQYRGFGDNLVSEVIRNFKFASLFQYEMAPAHIFDDCWVTGFFTKKYKRF